MIKTSPQLTFLASDRCILKAFNFVSMCVYVALIYTYMCVCVNICWVGVSVAIYVPNLFILAVMCPSSDCCLCHFILGSRDM